MGLFNKEEPEPGSIRLTTALSVVQDRANGASIREIELAQAETAARAAKRQNPKRLDIQTVEVDYHAPAVMEMLILGGRAKALAYCRDRNFTNKDANVLLAEARLLLRKVGDAKGEELLDLSIARYNLLWEKNHIVDPAIALRAQQQIDRITGAGNDNDPKKLLEGLARIIKDVTEEEDEKWSHVVDADFTEKPTTNDGTNHGRISENGSTEGENSK